MRFIAFRSPCLSPIVPQEMSTKIWPKVVKAGHAVVRIYRESHHGTKTGVMFTVAWNTPAGRKRVKFANLDAALVEARAKVHQLAAGRIEAASMTGDDRDELAAARKIAARFELPVMAALAEWSRARELTQGNVIAACEAWAARNSSPVDRITVEAVVRKFLAAKTAAGIKTAENHAHIFADLTRDFGSHDLDTISALMLDKWLARWEHPSTRNTFRKHLVALWRWSQKKGYLSRELKTEAENTERAVEAPLVPGIIDAPTFGRLLEFFRTKHPEYLSALALAGFCGLRRSEIHAQRWEDVNLAEGHLKVSKAKRGTPSRRLVTLCPAVIAWLKLETGRKGTLCENLAVDRIRKIAMEATDENGKRVFDDLPENCFRHAFISHRVAATGDVARTSLEAGNSPDMIRKHYMELVTRAEGEAWFELQP